MPNTSLSSLTLDPFTIVCEFAARMRGIQSQFSLPAGSVTGRSGAESVAHRPFISKRKAGRKRWLRSSFLPAALVAVTLASQMARASIITWAVDPTVSYIRLTIPDQSIAVTNLGDITLRMRDANSATQWTDAGGRRAALEGTIATDYVEATSIEFLGGSHNLQAIETTSLRPNPAKWDAVATNYSDTSTAPAALGGRVRGTYLLTFDAAFVAFRALRLDITNATPGPIAITNSAFAANASRCGIAAALVDVDGLELPLGLGQPVPDALHGSLPPVVQMNSSAGTILSLGGLDRQLTYPISIPDLTIDLGGTVITGSAAGLIVAYATLPTLPSSPTLRVGRQGDEIVLSWPTNATGFSLEYATDLPATEWLPTSPSPAVANGQFVVTNVMTRETTVYRLHWQ